MSLIPQKDLRRKLGYTQASNFFLTFWAPVLGAGPSMLYLQLRKRCLDDNPFKATNRALMGELGISDFHTFSKYQNKLESNRLIIFKVIGSDHSRFSRETCYYIEDNPPFLEPHHYEKLPPRLQKSYIEFIERSERIFLDQLLDFSISERTTERTFAVKTTVGSALNSTAVSDVFSMPGSVRQSTAFNNNSTDMVHTLDSLLCKCEKFKGLRPEVFADLVGRFGMLSVCNAVEVLSYQYRDVEIRCPSALLKKTLEQGLEIPDAFFRYKRSLERRAEIERHTESISVQERIEYENTIRSASEIILSESQEEKLIAVINHKYRSIPDKIRMNPESPLMKGIYAMEKMAIYNGGNGHDK